MLRDITLGQYYATDSPIHRLDARMKIICALAYIVALFFVKDYSGFVVPALALVIVIGLSHVPFSYIMRGMKPVLIIILFTFLLNLFMIQGKVLWQWWIFHITAEGLHTAVFMVVRVVMLIISSSLLTYTTKPVALTDGLEKLGRPLKKIGFPAHDMAMMMTIALRFIPTLLEELDKIMKAQAARGADFESGNLMQRIKALIPVVVPLFISAFMIARDLAIAMEARCYRGDEGRTRMHEIRMQGRDYAFGLLCLLMVCMILVQAYVLPGIL